MARTIGVMDFIADGPAIEYLDLCLEQLLEVPGVVCVAYSVRDGLECRAMGYRGDLDRVQDQIDGRRPRGLAFARRRGYRQMLDVAFLEGANEDAIAQQVDLVGSSIETIFDVQIHRHERAEREFHRRHRDRRCHPY